VARGHVARLGQKHRDVETIGESATDLDRCLVAAIYQGDAATLERHQGDGRRILACRRDQRCGLWASRGRILRPSRGFSNVDEGER
jgi:hypothetical protein